MAKQNLPTTQSHLDIEDIREDLVILKNGNIAMVIETTSLNFELLSEDEQDARILSFASLLNALNFTLQIVIRTERRDVNDYLDKLVSHMNAQTSPALRRQMEIYINFVQNLTTKAEVLKKRFFLVVSTNYPTLSSSPSIIDIFLPKPRTVDASKNILRAQDYLNPKREFLVKQFKKMGITAQQLNTNQLIQLFYDIYDPDKVGVRRVNVADDYTKEVVEPLLTEDR